jgi:hypothetical protein
MISNPYFLLLEYPGGDDMKLRLNRINVCNLNDIVKSVIALLLTIHVISTDTSLNLSNEHFVFSSKFSRGMKWKVKLFLTVNRCFYKT